MRRVVTYLGRLQSVTQNREGGLSLQIYVKMSTSKRLQMYARMYHGCSLGTCEHLPSPAMLTVAALVRSEDDLKTDGNNATASSDTDATTQRANVVRAATEIRNNLWMGGKADATHIQAQSTFLASDFEMYAKHRQTVLVFSLSEALHGKGWYNLTKLAPGLWIMKAQSVSSNF